MRTHNGSTIDRILGMPERTALHPWPEDCHIQGGGDGIVMESGSLEEAITNPGKAAEAVAGALGADIPSKHYRTAFFEAFPRQPNTFIRGEGKTIDEAENDAWAQYQRMANCPAHEYERREYRTGCGICKHCGMFGIEVFDKTLDPCSVCGADHPKASYGVDRHGKWHCEKCYRGITEDNKSDMHKRADEMRASFSRPPKQEEAR